MASQHAAFDVKPRIRRLMAVIGMRPDPASVAIDGAQLTARFAVRSPTILPHTDSSESAWPDA